MQVDYLGSLSQQAGVGVGVGQWDRESGKADTIVYFQGHEGSMPPELLRSIQSISQNCLCEDRILRHLATSSCVHEGGLNGMNSTTCPGIACDT